MCNPRLFISDNNRNHDNHGQASEFLEKGWEEMDWIAMDRCEYLEAVHNDYSTGYASLRADLSDVWCGF